MCQSCGCTEHRPCDGGCAWLTPDLCSRCVSPVLTTVPIDPQVLAEPIGLECTILTLLAIHGHLLLGLRQAEPDGRATEMISNIVQQLEEVLVEHGVLTSEQAQEIRRTEHTERRRIIVVPG